MALTFPRRVQSNRRHGHLVSPVNEAALGRFERKSLPREGPDRNNSA